MLQNSTIQTAMSSEQNMAGYDLFSDVSDDSCSCSSVYSVEDISSITGANNDDIACLDDIQEYDYDCEESEIAESESAEESTANLNANELEITQEQPLSISPGYVLVIDNIDLNVRRSNQRIGRTTTSYHFCHGYAVQNRVNSTQLTDGPPSGALSLGVVLPNKDDLASVLSNFEVLVSR